MPIRLFAAYAMPKGADIPTFLLALNQTCAAREAAGDPITPLALLLPVARNEVRSPLAPLPGCDILCV